MNNIDTKKDLVTQLLSLAMEITSESIIDIFVDFSSHIQSLDVRVLLNGWKLISLIEDEVPEYDFKKTIYLEWKNSEKELQEVLDYFKKLKEEQ